MKLTENKKWVFAWLPLGTVLMYFSNWNWAVPAATWLFSIFLLRFSRSLNKSLGLPVLCFACIIVGVVSMWNLLAIDVISPSFRFASGVVLGVISFLPFAADRLLISKLPEIVGTLVFPCSWVALEYIKSLGNGSWGALAYTQYGNLSLMQLASITGIWGISFIIIWFASIVNFAWAKRFAWPDIRKAVFLYGLIISFIFLYGYIRPADPGESADNVCIGSVTNPRDFVSRFYGPDWTDRKTARQSMQQDLGYLFTATRDAARNDAEIVFWQEYAVSVMEENEQELIDRAKDLARDERVYLVLALGLFPLNYPERLWQNKLIWINPDGKVIAEYLKLKPAPPLEPIPPGEGKIPVIETLYGKIASVICADLDYPSLIHQAGRDDAGILLIPAQSWPSTDPLHTYMAVYRAIENGFSLVMGTGGGLSIAVDPYGRTIKSSDYYDSLDKPMIACLPTKGIKTIYSIIGDTFAWICILGVVTIAGWSYFFTPDSKLKIRR